MKRIISCLIVCAALSGCVSGGGKSITWWNPSTWGAASEARKVERLEGKYKDAREDAIKSTQKAVYEAGKVLTYAKQEKPTILAQEGISDASAVLAQVAGPLTLGEQEAIHLQVSKLLGENEADRKKAEALRLESRRQVAELSERLAKIEHKLDTAQEALPDAQYREASVANRWRNAVFLTWVSSILGVILIGVFAYFKIMYGGVWSGLGRGLSSIYAAHPKQAQNVELLLSQYLPPKVVRKILANS